VILLSDNGGLSSSEGSPTSNLPLRGGKGWLYEGGIRVPFVIRVPGSVTMGTTSEVPVTTLDIAATLYDILDIDDKSVFDKLDGDSLKTLLIGKSDSLPERPLFFHYPHYSNQGGFPGAAVRLGPWKFIERFEDGGTQLFNVAEDKEEKFNLVKHYPERAARMRRMLHKWYEEENAAFLRSSPERPEFGVPWTPVQ